MKKVYFIISHLRAGGSSRVFWILSQYFDKSIYDVSLILLDSRNPFFSTDIEGVNIINLDSVRASNSFFKLRKLIKEERPYAIFTTGGHINTLLSLISLFVYIPKLIGRESNVMDVMTKLSGIKDKLWDLFVPFTYKRFNIAVCQSVEIRDSLANHYQIPPGKLVVIPNPVLPAELNIKTHADGAKKIIIIARLAVEKGILRLLEIIKGLPEEYSLTIIGEGPLKGSILSKIKSLKLSNRVQSIGLVSNVSQAIARHNLLVLPSFTEGFPNVVLESLAVGIPVVAFRVGGVDTLLKNNFNGFIVEPHDVKTFADYIVKACNQQWDYEAIRADVNFRFGVHKVVKQYEALLS